MSKYNSYNLCEYGLRTLDKCVSSSLTLLTLFVVQAAFLHTRTVTCCATFWWKCSRP